jgi:hypothetical protein
MDVAGDNTMKSETRTVVDDPADVLANLKPAKKYVLLLVFTLAQFMDVATDSMVLANCLPSLSVSNDELPPFPLDIAVYPSHISGSSRHGGSKLVVICCIPFNVCILPFDSTLTIIIVHAPFD